MLKVKDYYSALGVPYNASRKDIKKAFYKIALENHPDKYPGDKSKEEKFKDASEAYRTLDDQVLRESYDRRWKFYYGPESSNTYSSRPFSQKEDKRASKSHSYKEAKSYQRKKDDESARRKKEKQQYEQMVEDITRAADHYDLSNESNVLSALEIICSGQYDQRFKQETYLETMSWLREYGPEKREIEKLLSELEDAYREKQEEEQLQAKMEKAYREKEWQECEALLNDLEKAYKRMKRNPVSYLAWKFKNRRKKRGGR